MGWSCRCWESQELCCQQRSAASQHLQDQVKLLEKPAHKGLQFRNRVRGLRQGVPEGTPVRGSQEGHPWTRLLQTDIRGGQGRALLFDPTSDTGLELVPHSQQQSRPRSLRLQVECERQRIQLQLQTWQCTQHHLQQKQEGPVRLHREPFQERARPRSIQPKNGHVQDRHLLLLQVGGQRDTNILPLQPTDDQTSHLCQPHPWAGQLQDSFGIRPVRVTPGSDSLKTST